MRRATVHLLTCGLSLATAVALLGAAATVRDAPVVGRSDGATAAVVRGFYDAVNHALRAGDPRPLERVVAPEVVVHAPPPSTAPDRAGLIRYLTDVRTAFPRAQLVVEDLIAVGDRALVRLALIGGREGAFLGLRVGGDLAFWGRHDVLRVAGGRVVEVRSVGEGRGRLEPLRVLPLAAPLVTDHPIRLERHTFPGDHQTVQGPVLESRVIYVEAGTITVARDASPGTQADVIVAGRHAAAHPTVVAPGTAVTLGAGDALTVPARTRYVLRHDGDLPTPVLVVVAFPAYPNDGPFQVPGNGASVQASQGPVDAVAPIVGVGLEHLVDVARTALPKDATAALGRLSLAGGAALSLREAAGPVLLVVEAGALGMETRHGEVWKRGLGGASREAAVGSFGAGDGAVVPAGTALTLRALGNEPATGLVVAILPAAETAPAPSRALG